MVSKSIRLCWYPEWIFVVKSFQFERLYLLYFMCCMTVRQCFNKHLGLLFIWSISLVFLQVCFVNSNSGSPSVYSFWFYYLQKLYEDNLSRWSILCVYINENGPMDNILWPQPVVTCSNICVSYSFTFCFDRPKKVNSAKQLVLLAGLNITPKIRLVSSLSSGMWIDSN